MMPRSEVPRDINACLVVRTSVDEFGQLQNQHRREFRVTPRAIKRMVRAELAESSPLESHVHACGLVTRASDFFGIEVIRSEGGAEELDLIGLQRSLLTHLERFGVLSTSDVHADLKRPMTVDSHGAFVDRLEATNAKAPPLKAPVLGAAIAAGIDALRRSIEIPIARERLGVQMAKQKLLPIRADANPIYALDPAADYF